MGRKKLLEPKGVHTTAFLNPDLKKAFEVYCKDLDLSASQLVRRLIREELKHRRWQPHQDI